MVSGSTAVVLISFAPRVLSAPLYPGSSAPSGFKLLAAQYLEHGGASHQEGVHVVGVEKVPEVQSSL